MFASLNIGMLCYAGLGAIALWMRLQYGSSFQKGLEGFINEIIDDFHVRVIVQLVIFAIFGALLSVILVEPSTERQALAAGMAWTTLLGNAATARTKKGKPNAGAG